MQQKTEKGLQMIKRLITALMAIVAGATLASAPAQASVPDWDIHGTVHSAAEWNSIKTVLDTPADWAYFHSLPASPSAQMKKDAGDCTPPAVGQAGKLCLWNGYSYQGTVWQIPAAWLMDRPNTSVAYNGLSFTGSGINNASKGWWNRTYLDVVLYDNESCQLSGWFRTMTSQQFAVSDNAASNDWENRIGSASFTDDQGNYCFPTPGQ